MMAPYYMRQQFSFKYTPLKFDLVQENDIKCQNWSKLGWLADNPIHTKWPALWSPKYMSWQFFSENGPPFNLDIVLKMSANFQFGLFCADWQTPHMFKTARNVGPQIQELAFFFKKLTTFKFAFCTGICFKISKLVKLGRLTDYPFVQNGLHCRAPNTWVGICFHKMDPFHFGYCTGISWTISNLVHFWVVGKPPYEQQLQGGLKFATQTLPLLHYHRHLQQYGKSSVWSYRLQSKQPKTR